METKFNIGQKVYIPAEVKEIYINEKGRIEYRLNTSHKVNYAFEMITVDEEDLINA